MGCSLLNALGRASFSARGSHRQLLGLFDGLEDLRLPPVLILEDQLVGIETVAPRPIHGGPDLRGALLVIRLPREDASAGRPTRHPQPRLREGGSGVDESGDDEARANAQRGENLGEGCSPGALRFPWL